MPNEVWWNVMKLGGWPTATRTEAQSCSTFSTSSGDSVLHTPATACTLEGVGMHVFMLLCLTRLSKTIQHHQVLKFRLSVSWVCVEAPIELRVNAPAWVLFSKYVLLWFRYDFHSESLMIVRKASWFAKDVWKFMILGLMLGTIGKHWLLFCGCFFQYSLQSSRRRLQQTTKGHRKLTKAKENAKVSHFWDSLKLIFKLSVREPVRETLPNICPTICPTFWHSLTPVLTRPSNFTTAGGPSKWQYLCTSPFTQWQ